jgi:hypothetical protein
VAYNSAQEQLQVGPVLSGSLWLMAYPLALQHASIHCFSTSSTRTERRLHQRQHGKHGEAQAACGCELLI